jgi:HD superfamily phosphohydrolase
VSGSLDLDKMEYLRRDARFCGVPYGEVDVSRLLQGLALLRDPVTDRYEMGVHEKAVSALESLLFAKYQMFRNVYWHHAVRAATALYKRLVEESVRSGLIAPDELIGPTDEELLHLIGRRAHEDDGEVAERVATRWLPALRQRRLPKRALELTAADLAGRHVEDWAVGDSPWKRAVEDDLAAQLGLESGEVVIDFPAKPQMFQLDLLVERRGAQVQRLDMAGLEGLLDLPRVAQELYQTARVLRVFTFERRQVSADALLDRITRPAGSA